MDKKTIKTITGQRIISNLLDTIVKELAEIKETIEHTNHQFGPIAKDIVDLGRRLDKLEAAKRKKRNRLYY